MADNREYISRVSEGGSVHISEDVIGIIALEAMHEVEGFGGVSAALSKDIADRLSKKGSPRGITVLHESESVSVSLNAFVTIRYGYSVAKVSRALQDAIQKAVEDMTGIPVSAVNIHVSGIAFDKTKQ